MKIKCDGGTVDLDINAILDEMPEEQRISVTENAGALINHIKIHHPSIHFSIANALEILCKLGMYAAEHPYERILE